LIASVVVLSSERRAKPKEKKQRTKNINLAPHLKQQNQDETPHSIASLVADYSS